MGLIISYSSSYPDDQNIYLRGFCEQILKTDYFIRTAIIVDHSGHIIASAFRAGLVQSISGEEAERAAVQAIIRSATQIFQRNSSYNSTSTKQRSKK